MEKKEFLDFLSLPMRPKPRKVGLTSFFDYFLPTKEIESLLETAAEIIDYAKLIHIGLDPTLPKGWLRKKLQIYKDHNIRTYPGGVPFQVAWVQDKAREFIRWLKEQGFDAIEIADDAMVTSLSREQRRDMIKLSLDLGLEVITELGKKNPKEPLNLGEAYESIQDDLSLGVSHVTIERAELDIYMDGDPSPLVNLVKKVGLKHLFFEPGGGGPLGFPKVHSWCFQTFGPEVNLGNIMSDQLIMIEWARKGLSRLVNFSYFH